jgi:hypothetical protein
MQPAWHADTRSLSFVTGHSPARRPQGTAAILNFAIRQWAVHAGWERLAQNVSVRDTCALHAAAQSSLTLLPMNDGAHKQLLPQNQDGPLLSVRAPKALKHQPDKTGRHASHGVHNHEHHASCIAVHCNAYDALGYSRKQPYSTPNPRKQQQRVPPAQHQHKQTAVAHPTLRALSTINSPPVCTSQVPPDCSSKG